MNQGTVGRMCRNKSFFENFITRKGNYTEKLNQNKTQECSTVERWEAADLFLLYLLLPLLNIMLQRMVHSLCQSLLLGFL